MISCPLTLFAELHRPQVPKFDWVWLIAAKCGWVWLSMGWVWVSKGEQGWAWLNVTECDYVWLSVAWINSKNILLTFFFVSGKYNDASQPGPGRYFKWITVISDKWTQSTTALSVGHVSSRIGIIVRWSEMETEESKRTEESGRLHDTGKKGRR